MHDETWIRSVLEPLSESFAHTAVECVRIMFQSDVTLREPWQVTDQLQGSFDYVFSLVSHNERFKSNLCIGIGLECMSTIIGVDITLEEAKDAFCEFANAFCGMIMDIPAFTAAFGVLVQELPEDAVHQAFFPRAWALQGSLYRGDGSMYLGYSVSENRALQFDM